MPVRKASVASERHGEMVTCKSLDTSSMLGNHMKINKRFPSLCGSTWGRGWKIAKGGPIGLVTLEGLGAGFYGTWG